MTHDQHHTGEPPMKPSVDDYLIQLHKKHGTLTPELVVADARQKTSPLHSLFQWDVKKAALEHWYDVARQLIRNVRVTVVNEERTVRAPYFVRDPRIASGKQGYTSIDIVRSDADMARDAVADECSRAAAAFQRALNVAAAVGIHDDIRALLQETLDLGQRVRRPEASA